MPARAIASGTVSFGLVAIPIKLYASGESSASIRFNMVHEKCGTKVKYRYYCPTDDELVERDEIAKGYEVSKGRYVLFSPDEIKALLPEPTNAIEITEFVPLEQVDAVYYEKAYYLGPDKGGEKPYRLLSSAMRKTGRAALARYAARGKNYLVLLRPFQEGLLMQQLRYADEVRPFEEVPLGDAEVKDAELDLAVQLVEQIATDEFQPGKYEDQVRHQIQEMIDRKIEGEEITAAPEAAPQAKIIDLMEALKASLQEGGTDADAGRKPPQRADGAEGEDASESEPGAEAAAG